MQEWSRPYIRSFDLIYVQVDLIYLTLDLIYQILTIYLQTDFCPIWRVILMHRKFRIFFPTENENLVFLVHDDHIFFALAGEKGIEISVCFEALDANFWWPLRDVIPMIKARAFSRPTEVC